MKQGIVIVRHHDSEPYFNLMSTLDTAYDILVVSNTPESNKYECLGVQKGYDYGFDEFLVLPSTCEIKDNKLFDLVFKEHAGKSVFFNYNGQMFMNKYRREVLEKTGLPEAHDKGTAIGQEGIFHKKYRSAEEPVVLFRNFQDTHAREEKFGRTNMVIENEYIKKYKGTWRWPM